MQKWRQQVYLCYPFKNKIRAVKEKRRGWYLDRRVKASFFSKIFDDGLGCVYVLRERGSRDGGKWRDWRGSFR